MADELVKSITDKPVKDTVKDVPKEESKFIDSLKEMMYGSSSFLSDLSKTISTASNTVSMSVSSITSKLDDSIKSFSSEVGTGLKTTLGDLTKKHGNMVNETNGKTSAGATKDSPAFITNLTSNTLDPIKITDGSSDDLVKSFSNGNIDKLASSVGMSGITNGSSLNSAMKSSSLSFSDLTTGAKSIIGDVSGLPKSGISTVASSVNESTSGLMSSIKSSVNEMTSAMGITDVNALIRDTYDIYKTGKTVYDVVSGKDGTPLLGIASKFNNSFGEVTNLMNLASRICGAMNGNSINDYRSNKDLMDLLLKRMSRQGMYGAVNQLMNCSDSQQYVDDRTYYMLSQEMGRRVSAGDVRTSSSIQRNIGNSRFSNSDALMYQLAYNMDDDRDLDEYDSLLSRMNVNKTSLVGTKYASSSGDQYVYSSGRVATLNSRNSNVTNHLTGNSTTSKVVSILDNLFG